MGTGLLARRISDGNVCPSLKKSDLPFLLAIPRTLSPQTTIDLLEIYEEKQHQGFDGKGLNE